MYVLQPSRAKITETPRPDLFRGPTCQRHKLVERVIWDPALKRCRKVLERVLDLSATQVAGEARKELYGANTEHEKGVRQRVQMIHHSLERF